MSPPKINHWQKKGDEGEEDAPNCMLEELPGPANVAAENRSAILLGRLDPSPTTSHASLLPDSLTLSFDIKKN